MIKELLKREGNIFFFNDGTWVDLTNLDTLKGRFKWCQSTNKIIKFKGKNNFGEFITGEFKILIPILNANGEYIKFKVLYNNAEYIILRSSIVNANFQNLLHREFKYEIGTTFNDEKGNITIIDRKSLSKSKRLYKYHCNNCGYEDWKVEIDFEKGRKTRCLCCCSAPKIVVSGINDIPTMAPWMVKYFPGGYEEAKLYTYGSGKEIDFICPDCGNIKRMEIHTLYENGFSCSCHGRFSYPERFFEEFLKQLKINYKRQLSRKDFNWIENYLYDFYLYDYNAIIETHGSQHYKETTLTQRTLFEEQENDKLKEQLAKNNKIKNYIILDCRKSEMEWIKNSILNSELNELFDLSNVDWKECEKFSEKSLLVKICNNWNNGMNSKEIREKYELSITTVNRYLNIGNEIGLCKYNTFEVNKRRNDIIWVYSKELDEYYTMSECKKIFNFNYNKLIRLIKENEKIKGYSFVFKKPPMNYKRGDIYETFL